MCSQAEAISILNQAAARYQAAFPDVLREAYLYGSYARGDYHAESDVDILMTADVSPAELSRYRDTLAHISSELSLEHNVTVSLALKPAEQFEKYGNILPFYRNVKQEGIRYAGRV